MRKLTAVAAIVFSLTTLSPTLAEAKPAYCSTALQGCYTSCQGAYGDDFTRSFCYAGCLIGYAGCGPA